MRSWGHAATYTAQTPNNVKLVWPSGGLTPFELWAPSALLSSVSAYYKDMFASGMQEAADVSVGSSSAAPVKRVVDCLEHALTVAPLSTDDSDTEADDIYRNASQEDNRPAQPPTNQPAPKHKHIVITHAKYATYIALLSWLQTGRIVFAPLKSSFATSVARIEPLRHALACKPHAPIPVSAKSVYKLAHYLDIPSLATISLDTYLSQIDVRHAAQEVFGPMLGFPEAKARLVSFMGKNKDAYKQAGGLKEVQEKLNRNELEGIEREVIEVLIGLA